MTDGETGDSGERADQADLSDPTGPAFEHRRVRALHALNMLDTPPEERFDRVTRLAQQLFDVETVTIALIDSDRQWFKSVVGDASQNNVPRADTFCNVTIQSPETLVVEDARRDDRFTDNPLVTDDPKIRFYAGHPIEAVGGERIGTLCLIDTVPRSFDEPDRALLRDLAQWVQSELTVADELDRASRVQQSLLPKNVTDIDGYSCVGVCAPTSAVGGDFYDWYPVLGGLTFSLGDVTGKGIGAAIIAATVRAVLRMSRDLDITTAVERAAESLAADLADSGTFVTLLHGRLDAASGVVRFVDAGHGLSLVVRVDGSYERLSSRGMPVGVADEFSWDPDSLVLDQGDTLVAVSDGVLDLFDGTLDSLGEVAGIVRASKTIDDAVKTLAALAAAQGSADDFTVIALHRHSA